jgi:hypothetical protein
MAVLAVEVQDIITLLAMEQLDKEITVGQEHHTMELVEVEVVLMAEEVVVVQMLEQVVQQLVHTLRGHQQLQQEFRVNMQVVEVEDIILVALEVVEQVAEVELVQVESILVMAPVLLQILVLAEAEADIQVELAVVRES